MERHNWIPGSSTRTESSGWPKPDNGATNQAKATSCATALPCGLARSSETRVKQHSAGPRSSDLQAFPNVAEGEKETWTHAASTTQICGLLFSSSCAEMPS